MKHLKALCSVLVLGFIIFLCSCGKELPGVTGDFTVTVFKNAIEVNSTFVDTENHDLFYDTVRAYVVVENEDDMYDALRDAFEDTMLAMIDDLGMTISQFESQIGMSLDDYLDSIMEQSRDENDDAEYSYEYEDGTLTLIREKDDETVKIEFEVKLKANSLEFKEYTGSSEHQDNAK